MKNFTTYSSVMGAVLSQYRQNLGLEQVEMAKKMGISQSTWSRLEHGDTVLNLEQLNQVAEKLGKTPTEIMKEVDDAKKKIEAEGIKVENERPSSAVKKGVAAAAAVALPVLAFFIARTLSDPKDEDKK